MQHSLWVVEVINSNLEALDPKASDLVAPGKLAKPFFRRIWQGKGSQTAASKVPKLTSVSVKCLFSDFSKNLRNLNFMHFIFNFLPSIN